MLETMRIGQVAQKLDLNPKTIRYYEEIGLLPEPRRTISGYRRYAAQDVERINFIRKARTLEMSLDEIGEILSFRDQGEAPCPYVLFLIEDKIEQVERKIEDLRELRRELRDLHVEAAALPLETLSAKGRFCHIIENRQLEPQESQSSAWSIFERIHASTTSTIVPPGIFTVTSPGS